MDPNYFRKITNTVILLVLIVLAFFLLRPILLPIILGVILAYIFNPLYIRLNNYIKLKNISVILICILLFLLILLPIWFLTPIAVDQSIKIYLASQKIDFVTPLKSVFPSLFASEAFSSEIGSIIHSFVTSTTNYLMNSFSSIISNFVVLSLKLFVVFFTFYFVLRDKEQIVKYIESLSPLSKDLEKKFFSQTKAITSSVLYGQVVIGIVQGVVAGIGFIIFGVPNALILTIFSCLAGIFPIIGTAVIWLPVVIYLFYTGDSFSAGGVLIFGGFSSIIDNFLRPFFVSKMTKIHPALILGGMIGGLFLFGILGFILGPLILAYLLIILELYRKDKSTELFIKHCEN